VTDAAHARSKNGARPFPWGTLDVVTQEDAAAARALRRWSSAFVRPSSVAAALSALLDARVEVIVRRVRSGARAPHDGEEGVAVLLGPTDAPETPRAAIVEVEPALGAALLARVLRRPGPRVLAPTAATGPLAGSIAAIVLAAARRVHANRALRVLAAGPARALERDLTSAGGELIEATLTVIVNDDAFAARVLVPRAIALAAPGPAWTRAALAALGEVPLSLPIVAAVSRSTAGEVGTLRRGDAWLPGGWALRRSAAGQLEGPVLLASPSHEVGFRAVLGDEGRIVVRGEAAPLAWAAEPRFDAPRRALHREEEGVSEVDKDALVQAVGEIPVVVRVEIGVAEMRAREWASLAPGDVVSLGRKIGEAVTLRVGGVTVARGELVDLDGEVGVRILGRTDGESPDGHARSSER